MARTLSCPYTYSSGVRVGVWGTVTGPGNEHHDTKYGLPTDSGIGRVNPDALADYFVLALVMVSLKPFVELSCTV